MAELRKFYQPICEECGRDIQIDEEYYEEELGVCYCKECYEK